jgi:hypothetical protein
MAEYIEREALLSELQEEIDFETSWYTDEQNKYFNMGLKCAVRDVKSQPTADVVPKSEVDRVYYNLQAVLEERAETKQEIAREIFEEIERFLYMHFRFCKEEIGNDDFEYIKGRLEMNTQIQSFIAERKNKYKEIEK